MSQRTSKLLWDIVDSAKFLVDDTAHATLNDYLSDRRLRQSVERSFEIIAEGLLRLERMDPATSELILDRRKIIGLRNRLSHGYDTEIDDTRVWETVNESVPQLLETVRRLVSSQT